MAKIHYVIGDATDPIVRDNENSLIVHCCNTLGFWGAGFVVPLGKRYPKAKESYKQYIEKNGKGHLADVDEVKVADNIYVENLIGQSFLYKQPNGQIPCNYLAIELGFRSIIEKWMAKTENYSIHMPRIGCGLAGGDWKTIENIIQRIFIDIADVDVFVYDLKDDGKTEYER